MKDNKVSKMSEPMKALIAVSACAAALGAYMMWGRSAMCISTPLLVMLHLSSKEQ